MSYIKTLMENLSSLEEKMGYHFLDKGNITLAMTHSSYANESRNTGMKSNERLEFLGDAVLNVVISEYIYMNHSQLSEGEMTKIRAHIVCEPSLEKCSNAIGLGKYLMLGKGEEITGGRTRTSILSDAFEATIGAIYIDGGMEQAKSYIYKHMHSLMEDAVKGIIFMDYKTQLQEVVQKDGEKKIVYEVIDEKGPDHNKLFVSRVTIDGQPMGIGEGKSKKEAEQHAARSALEKLKH